MAVQGSMGWVPRQRPGDDGLRGEPRQPHTWLGRFSHADEGVHVAEKVAWGRPVAVWSALLLGAVAVVKFNPLAGMLAVEAALVASAVWIGVLARRARR